MKHKTWVLTALVVLAALVAACGEVIPNPTNPSTAQEAQKLGPQASPAQATAPPVTPAAVPSSAVLYLLPTKLPSDGGTILMVPPPDQNGGYAPGTAVTLGAIPSPGYAFDRWVGGPSGETLSTDNPLRIVVKSNLGVAAVFRKEAVGVSAPAAARPPAPAAAPSSVPATAPVPAPATVTLSGRVTDRAGQPVEGAQVFLQKMPGFVYVKGADTQKDGSYRLQQLPSGSYRLVVNPRKGPWVPQYLEQIALPADTHRNFALEGGVTLSGRVTDASGNAVPRAYVSVRRPDGEVSFANGDMTGRYSLGVPAGTYTVAVSSPEKFVRKTINDAALARDQVLDITLEAGATVQGKVVDQAGQPLVGANIRVAAPTGGMDAVYNAGTRADGTFTVVAPPGVYALTADPLPPLNPVHMRLDTQSGDVNGLVLQASNRPASAVPDAPPRASLINVSAPDSGNMVSVGGAPGAVLPSSYVVLVTMDTGDWTWVHAAADGSFRASLFAPAGTSVLVKADPYGAQLRAQRLTKPEDPRPGSNALSPLPGTVLRVGDPPGSGSGVPFAGAGRTGFAPEEEPQFPVWTFQGTISSRSVKPGEQVQVRGTLRVASPALRGASSSVVNTTLTLERLSGPDGTGSLARDSYASVFLTPTGLPVERMPRHNNEGLDQFLRLTLTKQADDRLEGNVDVSLKVPSSLLAGYYRPLIQFNFQDIPRESPPIRPMLNIDRANRRPVNVVFLPVVKVGTPETPRLFWTLLTDTLSNGTRGARALEDRSLFGIAPRILTNSETFIVPRVDSASGRPVTYRLEPFAPTVCLDDAAVGAPPLIPFRFPSGMLTVRVQGPDGPARVLGPAAFAQTRVKSLANRDGNLVDAGGGHMTDVCELSTLDSRFEVQFDRDGRYLITLEGPLRTSGATCGPATGPTRCI